MVSVSVWYYKNVIQPSLLSLSEYAPSKLRDDDPFCAWEAFVEPAVNAFESVKQNTQSLLMSEIDKASHLQAV